MVSYHRLWFQLWWEAWAITKLIHVGWGSSICKTWIHTQFVSAYAHLHGIEVSTGREQSGNWWHTGSWVNNNNVISSCPPWGATVCQTLCVSAGSPWLLAQYRKNLGKFWFKGVLVVEVELDWARSLLNEWINAETLRKLIQSNYHYRSTGSIHINRHSHIRMSIHSHTGTSRYI